MGAGQRILCENVPILSGGRLRGLTILRVRLSIKPRKWQKKALKLWANDLRGIARVVTGGGKTVFAYLCIEEFLRKFHNGRVVIIVPTIALLDQWYLDVIDSIEICENDIACYSGGNRPEYPGLINIMVLNTARWAASEISEFDSTPKMLIVDECHRAGSWENARSLNGEYEATLGLSATPERESDEGFEERIVPALGPIFFEYDYREASRDGVIVDFDLINVEVNAASIENLLQTSVGVEYQNLSRSAANDSDRRKIESTIRKRAERTSQTAFRVPWAVKLTLAHRGERIVIFHERVASLERIVALLAQYGQNAVLYHSRLNESHRRDNLRLFRRGMVNVLVTCRALDEGANIPEANIAIIARSTSSTRQRIQRLGRVLRPAAKKSAATVYTLFTGEDERERLADEARGLEGVARIIWKRGTIQ